MNIKTSIHKIKDLQTYAIDFLYISFTVIQHCFILYGCKADTQQD